MTARIFVVLTPLVPLAGKHCSSLVLLDGHFGDFEDLSRRQLLGIQEVTIQRSVAVGS